MKITTKYNKGQRVFWKIQRKTLIGFGTIEDLHYRKGIISYYIDIGVGLLGEIHEEKLYPNIEDVSLEDE